MSDRYDRYGAQGRTSYSREWDDPAEYREHRSPSARRQYQTDQYADKEYRSSPRRPDAEYRDSPYREQQPAYGRADRASTGGSYPGTYEYFSESDMEGSFLNYDQPRWDRFEYQRGPVRSHLRCRDIMSTRVKTALQETPIREIARMMRGEDVGAVPILSADGKLAGIVTDRDLIVGGLTQDKGDNELTAEDCMSKDVYTAKLNDRVVDAIEEMRDHQVRRVPVVDNKDRLVGIVSLSDVALASEGDPELSHVLEDISKPSSWLGRLANFFGL